ncbi:N-acetylglucosamine-6-phosphate deacetylase [soil metagenome]
MEIPGFVDLQVNGFKGVDFSSEDLTEKSFIYACQELIKQGTIVFLPTIITNSPKVFERNLRLMVSCIVDTELHDHIPGFHIEGPFISPEDGARGAHNKAWVRDPDLNFLEQLFHWSAKKIKILTIAAELVGADELCKKATQLGITVSLGHHLANAEDIKKLAESGAKLLTHLGNGLPQMIHRHNNPLWEGISNDELMATIITDGHHIPPALIKTIIRAKETSKLIVVSDASPIAGLPPGKYHTLGNEAILEPSGLLINPKTGYLVGSSSTMIDCLNYLWSLNLISYDQLIDLGFYNPLNLLKIDPVEIKSRIEPRVRWKNKFELINSI